MSDFTGKRVLVTGSAGVAGLAVAGAFHEAGATVTGVDIIAHDAPWRTLVADLIDPEGARTAVAQAGVIDVLANIAGGFTMGDDIVGTTDETWDFMMNLNARTVLNMCRAVVPGMVGALSVGVRGETPRPERALSGECAGKIVNIGARGALRGAAAMGAYIASKSVVMRLTETLSDELKHKGVNVNCILPSIIDTPRNRADMPKAKFEQWVSPEDIAGVVLFLASPAADAIHGASIPVEGLS